MTDHEKQTALATVLQILSGLQIAEEACHLFQYFNIRGSLRFHIQYAHVQMMNTNDKAV